MHGPVLGVRGDQLHYAADKKNVTLCLRRITKLVGFELSHAACSIGCDLLQRE
jgi:hypothetical protein